MTHRAHPDFWACYEHLPEDIKDLADKCFVLRKESPGHPFLRLKKVGAYWSARVGRNHRAVAIDIDDGLLWTWIGNHDDYERLIGS